MQHQFFQGFFPPKEQQTQISRPHNIIHNDMVLEISNNWESIKDLIDRIKKEQVDTVSNLEKEWINFLNVNKINLDIFKNEDEFVVKNLKPLCNEK